MNVMTLSTKGQVSIPAKARKQMNIDSGDKLAYMVYGDTLIIKPIKMPTEQEFEESLDAAQEWAAAVGYKEDDVNDIIKSVRRKKRA